MRHAVFGRRLGRDTKSRKALLYGLSSSILETGQTTTTLAKAKFVQPFIDKLVTAAKKDKLFVKRQLASGLKPLAFRKLTEEIGPGFEKRVGGYTKIIKLGTRRGDNAQMARLQFMEWDKTRVKSAKKTLPKKIAKKITKSKIKKLPKAVKVKNHEKR
ncbi:50S ribosomal protein L17 [Candidatus Curtissbacteria bacterium RIFCSPHIGHO2_12_FULL_38_9b]|uniref:50S ribosomal protein L17 n=2 Tax=Candidatus Curtissiibacteriota TaxID=1752717 RepID=A0A1F5GXB3_9BACT|nr:MAG: 50S ribosomal protein L17 [Candidatus Curtissbacteria bacterium RIFCSPLOWO2_01_FULL_37_9]OGD96552.1 MAG: 50S ribosomal protein L17 [Candidatus Curtissbacteria bacterium RIFCSPHIGHO2_12_FULL_38_9b]